MKKTIIAIALIAASGVSAQERDIPGYVTEHYADRGGVPSAIQELFPPQGKKLSPSTKSMYKTFLYAAVLEICRDKAGGKQKPGSNSNIQGTNNFQYTSVYEDETEKHVVCGLAEDNTLMSVYAGGELIYTNNINDTPQSTSDKNKPNSLEHVITYAMQYEILENLSSKCKTSVKVRGGVKGRANERCLKFFDYNAQNKNLRSYVLKPINRETIEKLSAQDVQRGINALKNRNKFMENYNFIIAHP